MSKSAVGIIIAIVAVGGVVALAMTSSKNETPATTQPSTSTNQSTMDSNNQETSNFGENGSTETTESNNVTIQNFAFGPKNIKVKVGTKVTWTNQDSAGHDITPDQESDDFKASELLSKGESYEFTFTKAGTYAYHCSPHPYMKATVEVVE